MFCASKLYQAWTIQDQEGALQAKKVQCGFYLFTVSAIFWKRCLLVGTGLSLRSGRARPVKFIHAYLCSLFGRKCVECWKVAEKNSWYRLKRISMTLRVLSCLEAKVPWTYPTPQSTPLHRSVGYANILSSLTHVVFTVSHLSHTWRLSTDHSTKRFSIRFIFPISRNSIKLYIFLIFINSDLFNIRYSGIHFPFAYGSMVHSHLTITRGVGY